MPTKKNLLIAALVLLISAVVGLISHRSPHPARPPAIASSPPSAKPAVTATPVTLATPTPTLAPATTPGTPEPGEAERTATARMFAAHAPLRVPEVADPDSAVNRRILQTMVTKALIHSAAPAATLAPTK